MSRKQVAVRLVAEGGCEVRAEFQGVGDSGERAFQRIERQADSTGAALNRIMGLLGAAVSVRQLVRYADTWTDLQARVDLATGSQEAGAAVMARIGEMARRTYSSPEQTAEGWLANATALRELGMSTAATLDFQEALNNALVVSGAKAERASQVQNALSQAMALGVLRGQQLNTVIANGGRVAELLAAELGTTVSGLRQAGAQGLITGDVIRRALIGSLEQLREEADSMPATIGDAFTLIGNAALKLVGTWDQLSTASASVAAALILLADNMERVAAYALAFAGFMAGRWLVAIVAARVATMSLSAALVLLRGALIRTGIGAAIVAAGELVFWFGRLVSSAGGFGEAMSALWAVARAVFEGIVNSASALPDGLAAVWNRINAGFIRMVRDMQLRWADFLASMSESVDGVIGFQWLSDSLGDAHRRAMVTAAGIHAAMADAEDAASAASVRFAERWGASFESVHVALARLREIMAAAGDEGIDLNEHLARSVLAVDQALNRAGGAARRAGQDNVVAAEEAAKGWARVIEILGEYHDRSKDWGQGIGDAMISAFNVAEQAVGNFVRTGKMDFRELLNSIAADLTQLAMRMLVLGPISNALMNMLGSMSGGMSTAAALVPSFAGGGHTGWGARTGGLDGRGGILAMVHPQERIIDETRGPIRAAAPVVNVPVIVNDYSGAQVEAREEPDGQGGRRIIMQIGEATAAAMRQPGNPARRTLEQLGIRPRPPVR